MRATFLYGAGDIGVEEVADPQIVEPTDAGSTSSRHRPRRRTCASTWCGSAPGARTHWHSHAVGQSLHVTQGIARVGTRDGRVLEVPPGRTVWCPPGEEHWHRAAPGAFMEHLAMWEATEARDGSETTWAEPVTDEQYEAGR